MCWLTVEQLFIPALVIASAVGGKFNGFRLAVILINNYMEYTINRTKRNVIILSSSILILYVLTSSFFFFFKGPVKIDTLQIFIRKIIFLIPFGYLMFAFFDYLRHYKLKVLQIAILTIFIMEVILRSNLFTNIFDSAWTKAVFITVNAIWISATIILIIFLFQTKMKDYPGILSIRKYAISIILFFVIVTTIPFFVKPVNSFATRQLVELTFAIPYIFTIDFAIKLYSKK